MTLSPLVPLRPRTSGTATPVREAGGAAGRWITLHAEDSDEGTVHVYVGGANGRITKGPKGLLGSHIADLAGHHNVKRAEHHPVGHEPAGARAHPHYAEHEPPAKPEPKMGRPYARLHGAPQTRQDQPKEGPEPLTRRQAHAGLSAAQEAARGAKDQGPAPAPQAKQPAPGEPARAPQVPRQIERAGLERELEAWRAKAKKYLPGSPKTRTAQQEIKRLEGLLAGHGSPPARPPLSAPGLPAPGRVPGATSPPPAPPKSAPKPPPAPPKSTPTPATPSAEDQERQIKDTVAQHAHEPAARLRHLAQTYEGAARAGVIPQGHTANSLLRAAQRLQQLANDKDLAEGDLPYGLRPSGSHMMRAPLATSADERAAIHREARKSAAEHGRDLLRSLRKRLGLHQIERDSPLRVQATGKATPKALAAMQRTIDALPASHRELLAAHGTHVYRAGPGAREALGPALSSAHRRSEVGGAYAYQLREAHIFDRPQMGHIYGPERVAAHELGHALDHALGHLRTGAGERAQPHPLHADLRTPERPSAQRDFGDLYAQHEHNEKLWPYMRSKPAEMFAEGYAMHQQQPERLSDAAPDLHDYFSKLHEEIERRVREAQTAAPAPAPAADAGRRFSAPALAGAAR